MLASEHQISIDDMSTPTAINVVMKLPYVCVVSGTNDMQAVIMYRSNMIATSTQPVKTRCDYITLFWLPAKS